MTLVNKDLIFPDIDFHRSDDVISFLADRLYQQGNVKVDYKEHVLARELKYPTGLPTGKISVAIPHTDSQYVNQSVIAFATLRHPVLFSNMAVNDERLPVSIVAMLAIAEPHGQVEALQKLMTLFSDQALLASLIKSDDHTDIYKVLATRL